MASFFATKTVVVTGGASGIGLATVRKLLKLSATVHIIDQAPSAPPEFTNNKAHFYGSVDVSSRSAVHDIFSIILQETPDLYGLVNCAGICPYSGGLIEADDVYKKTMAVNVDGTWNCATELLKHIQSTHEGKDTAGRASIVNIGSSASLKGFPTLGAYCASKHAVLGLTRTWAGDFAPFGVRVNLVAPGGTNTPLAAAQLEDTAGRGDALAIHGLQLIPQKRQGEPEELADAIIFLLGDTASYITGQVLPVNGGYP